MLPCPDKELFSLFLNIDSLRIKLLNKIKRQKTLKMKTQIFYYVILFESSKQKHRKIYPF